MLLEAGANANKADNNGLNSLHAAALKDHEAVVKVLLKAGVDANKAGNNEAVPLHLAALNGHLAVVLCAFS